MGPVSLMNNVLLAKVIHGSNLALANSQNAVSIPRCAIVGFTHIFQGSYIFFRPMRDIPVLKLNDDHLLFEGQCLPSLKSKKSLFMQPSFFVNCIYTCILLSVEANLQFERVTSLYKYSQLNNFLDDIFTLLISRKKVTTRNNQNFID